MVERFGQDFHKVRKTKGFDKPLSWKEPGKVFVCPQSDFFIEEADCWRDEAWEIMRRTPHLTYLLLTKRPENVKDRLPADWPLPNVWLGVTVENQEQADKRIPILLGIEAVKRFVSVEPMLGPVDLDRVWLNFDGEIWIDWLICGGESGPNARPVHPDWVRSLRDQCAAGGVPFMFKQWGEWCPATREYGVTGSCMPVTGEKFTWLGGDGKTQNPSSHGLSNPFSMARMGKKAAGRLLDGKEYMEAPE
jgi:protein gp37